MVYSMQLHHPIPGPFPRSFLPPLALPPQHKPQIPHRQPRRLENPAPPTQAPSAKYPALLVFCLDIVSNSANTSIVAPKSRMYW